MSTDKNIQERAEKEYPSPVENKYTKGSMDILKQANQTIRNAHIKGATKERELMSNQWVSVSEVEAILRKYSHRMHESLFFDLINALVPPVIKKG